MKQSNWMRGLLWAENYIQAGNFFSDDPTGVESLHFVLYHSDEFCEESLCGARDYLEYYKRLVEGDYV